MNPARNVNSVSSAYHDEGPVDICIRGWSRLHLFSATAQGDGRVKNVEINEKAPHARAPPGNYRPVTQANLGWHADYLVRKVDH